jgi:hypothetical protein
MTYPSEVNRLERDTQELAIRMSIALSLTLSLAAAAILSKHRLTSYLWINVAALTIPLFLTSYFKGRIVSLGPYVYVAGLTVILGSAVLFGL